MVDRGASRAQGAQQTVGQDLVVFCNQDSHEYLLLCRHAAAAWAAVPERQHRWRCIIFSLLF
jgi:hypothetical protein